MPTPKMETPVDPLSPELASQRKAQIERYIQGSIIFTGQWYDENELLEASLANVLRAFGLPNRWERMAVTDDCPLAEIPPPLSEDDYGGGEMR